MKIAVIGAGIFGCTAAIHCARAGHQVDLFDHGPLLGGATSHNQFRLHLGYHYPRSDKTRRECVDGFVSFSEEYDAAINCHGRSNYAIASHGSRIDVQEYIGRLGILAEMVRDYGTELRNIDAVIRAPEPRLDIDILRLIIKRRLNRYGMTMLRQPMPGQKYRQEYDKIVVATYASTNRVLEELGTVRTKAYQFEVVEKPVIRLPSEFEHTGLVVMDGPFFSVDPYMETGLHLFGHVEHAIWSRNVGLYAEVPTAFAEFINRGVITATPTLTPTRFETMRDAAAVFMPAMKEAEHIGSMFTVRAVLPDVADTDERPTLVTQVDDQVMTIFGGKLPTAVEAAKQVMAMIGQAERIAA